MKVCVYGSRGSIPYANFGTKFGGNTSCMTIASGDEELVFDAGSGLYSYQEKIKLLNGGSFKNLAAINILLSHLHLDHIIGLGTFIPAWHGTKINIYTMDRGGGTMKEQVLGIFSPPYWPRDMKKLANVNIIEICPNESFKIGIFTVTSFMASHPDSTLSFHVTDGKKSFVHLLDSEYASEYSSEFNCHKGYIGGADLVVFDACYTPDDYPKHAGWGHSTVLHGVNIAAKWGVKLMMFSHFAQHYTDDELNSLSRYFDSNEFILARDGMELDI